jgi:transketolase C-terminal domain/subunit
VAEVLAGERPVPVVRVGIPDRFCEVLGPYEEMVTHLGLDAAGIARAARRALELKARRGGGRR